MSSNELNFEAEADPQVTAWLAKAYAPPAGEAYWPTLEGKIMDNIRSNGGVVGVVDIASYRSGTGHHRILKAAGLILALLLGAAGVYAILNPTQARMAIQSIIPGRMAPVTSQPDVKGIELEPGIDNTTAERTGGSQRGATFKDVIKP